MILFRQNNVDQTERLDYGYSFTFFSTLLKKVGRRKGEWSSKNQDKKTCISIILTPKILKFSSVVKLNYYLFIF